MEVTTSSNNNNARRRSLLARSGGMVQKDLLDLKTKHERLKTKYGYLWKSLSCDPAVIQEYQSLLLLQTPAAAAATAAARLDHETKTKAEDSIVSRDLSNSSDTLNDHEKNDHDSERIHNSDHVSDVDTDSDGAARENPEKKAATQQMEKTPNIDFLAAVESRRPIQFQIGSCCDVSNGCDGITCIAPIVETETVEEEEEIVGVETTSSGVVPLLRRNLSQMRNVHQEEDDTSTSVQSETKSNDALSFVERDETFQDGESVPLSQDVVDFDLSALNLHNDSVVDEGEEADDERVTNTRGVDNDDCYGKIKSVLGEEMTATKNNYNSSDESVSRLAESSSSDDDGTVTFTLNETSFISAGIIAMDNDTSQEQEYLRQDQEKKTDETAAAEKHTLKESDSVASSSDDAEWSENGSNKWVPPEQTIDSDEYSLETENKILNVEDSDDISYETFSRNEYSTTSESEGLEKENRRFDLESKDNTFGYINKDEKASTDNTKWSKSRSVPKDSERPKSQQRTNRQSSSIQRSKGNFKKNKEIITRQTFDEFDKLVFKNRLQDVQVQWSSRLIKTAGVTRLKKCRKGDSVIHTAMIELSTKLIDCEDRLRSTLCHEMCHAAQWLIDGVAKPPHGSCFKKWASLAMRKINGMLVTTTHDYVTNTFKFAWVSLRHACYY